MLIFGLILPLLGSVKSEKFPRVLTKEEEIRYLDDFKDGSSSARDKLIEHNLRLVAHIVKKYDNTKEEKDDLLSVGILGLVKGVDSYKHPSPTKLATYCARCIENEILMLLRSNKKRAGDISINTPIGTDKEGNEIKIIDTLYDTKVDIIKNTIFSNEVKKLKSILYVLDDRELEIITKRYGIFGSKVETQKEIAKRLDISRSYVSRLEKRALSKLLLKFKE